MKNVLIIVFLLLSFFAEAQIINESYIPAKDSIRIGPKGGDFLPCTDKGYTLIQPQSGTIRGIIISMDGSKFDLKSAPPSQQIYPAAIAKGFAVLYVCTGNPIEFFFDRKVIDQVDAMLTIIFRQYNIANNNIFLLGSNLSGTRGLKYLEYCRTGQSSFNPDLKGICLFDCSLDMVRMWNEGLKAIKDNVAESSVSEGKMITYLLKQHFAGKPHSFLNAYLNYCPYSYWDEESRHISIYKRYAVRAYTEPDVLWWMQHKGKAIFETNAPDMAGIINQLKLAGSKDAELIVFPEHREGPHNPDETFALADKEELINWMLKYCK